MESLDGTVISTSLPAIAADLHQDPIALKLALTSYLLSLAIFIPASGWAADKFGARTIFRSAILIFTLGSILCGQSSTLVGIRRRPHDPGAWRGDDGTGRPARPLAHGPAFRGRRRSILSHDPCPARPALRTADRRVHHNLFSLALDLLRQCADRHRGHRTGQPLHQELPRRSALASRRQRLPALGLRPRLPDLRAHRGRARGLRQAAHLRLARRRHNSARRLFGFTPAGPSFRSSISSCSLCRLSAPASWGARCFASGSEPCRFCYP